MFFQRIEPDKELSRLVECYWIIRNEDATPQKQKIIPDGFTELIFHFGDPFRIQLNKEWEVQSKSLLAGQIDKYFFLENTGVADILGIKLKPAALTHLFNLNMHEYTNKVVNTHTIPSAPFNDLEKNIRHTSLPEDRIGSINSCLKELTKNIHDKKHIPVDKAINLIFDKKGMITVSEICGALYIGERQLQNLFKRYVGLSPKLFARIIRFSYIFQLQEKNEQNWAGLAYEAAFYDQAHFIRNFKNFTGESPAAYLFEENNMANFFLKKK